MQWDIVACSNIDCFSKLWKMFHFYGSFLLKKVVRRHMPDWCFHLWVRRVDRMIARLFRRLLTFLLFPQPLGSFPYSCLLHFFLICDDICFVAYRYRALFWLSWLRCLLVRILLHLTWGFFRPTEHFCQFMALLPHVKWCRARKLSKVAGLRGKGCLRSS